MPWPDLQYLDETRPTAAENLAVDEALLLAAEDRGGPAILRTWELGHLAVVLGASGRIVDDLRREACRADGVEIARRSSGGGTVVIGPGALNVSVILPVDAAPELKTVEGAQAYILGRTAEAIRARGPAVEVLGSGDLTLDRRKFSGSAQRRLRNHVLVHASLLYDFPLDRISKYTEIPLRKPEYRGDRPHRDFVVNLPVGRDALLGAVRAAWPASGGGRERFPEDLVRELLATKFAKNGWIERL